MIKLQFPYTITFTNETKKQIVSLNPGLHLQFTSCDVVISERDIQFSTMDFFKLRLPFKIQEEELYQISELNQDLKLEGDAGGIIINVGTLGLIGAFTAVILGTIYIWNRRMKKGRVFDSSTNHDLQTKDGKKYRIPDVSFVAYERFASKVIDSNYRVGSPTLCIEVVSHKDSLNQDLEKMEQDWINGGTEIGIVVCPLMKEENIRRRLKIL